MAITWGKRGSDQTVCEAHVLFTKSGSDLVNAFSWDLKTFLGAVFISQCSCLDVRGKGQNLECPEIISLFILCSRSVNSSLGLVPGVPKLIV